MSIPTEHDDTTNAQILSVSEDLVEGFQEEHIIQQLEPDQY